MGVGGSKTCESVEPSEVHKWLAYYLKRVIGIKPIIRMIAEYASRWDGVVTTIAGDGTYGSRRWVGMNNGVDVYEQPFSDGVGAAARFCPATACCFAIPDAAVNDQTDESVLMVVDMYNRRIRRVHIRSGLVETFAGGGPNLNQTLELPQAICADPSRSVYYIADEAAIHVCASKGVGSGGGGGVVMETIAGSRTIRGYFDGTGTSAQFRGISCVILDPTQQNLIVCDQSNNRIRNVCISTKKVTTIAGSDAYGDSRMYRGTRCVLSQATDERDVLYFTAAQEIRRLELKTNKIKTIFKPALPKDIDGVRWGGIASLRSGLLLVSCYVRGGIVSVDSVSGENHWVAGGVGCRAVCVDGPALDSVLAGPNDILLSRDGRKLYICDGDTKLTHPLSVTSPRGGSFSLYFDLLCFLCCCTRRCLFF